MSLTCIGKTREHKVVVVWFFYGNDAIKMLKKHGNKKFYPRLYITVNSNNEFTIDYSNKTYRFDVGLSDNECKRLAKRKLNIAMEGQKHTFEYYNEDITQIISPTHRIEQQSINMTRNVCKTFDVKIQRFYKDNYTSIDFRIADTIRVQDKVASKNFHMRCPYRYPYNPDNFDIFQVTHIESKIVYAIPMRVIIDNDTVISYFSEDELMDTTVRYSEKWKQKHATHMYDLNKEEDIHKYLNACKNASLVPKLTDNKFFNSTIKNNISKIKIKSAL
jgi:hypothetical protein